ncbi:hypothetical protein Tco_1017987 [Tanacetum coccineum]|uniref:DUF641 domain-containing protein n=1 Tax=Tanacetum coccineum TaxID=301880 RepID=A0ABQ5FV17_9ASTR
MNDIIWKKNALKQEIDSLKQTLSKQVKEKELLLQTFTVFKKESKEKENKYMDKEIALENKIKELDNIVYKVGQSARTVHMLTKPQVFYDDSHQKALSYQNPFYLKKAQRIKPTLYDGFVISKKHDVISVVDEEETLILEEESRSKMLAKQNDPILKERKFNISPINYSELNKLSEDFGKCFVPQMQLSVEQAFWLLLSNPKSEQLDVTQTPVEIEVPKELPKVSLVKTSFQKLKNHLASFEKVVKVRTTPDAITEGSWGFEHTKQVFKEEVIPFINSLQASFKDFENGLHSEINEVKTVFNQMEAAVVQYVMNILMHADYVSINVLPANNKCLVDDILESERLIKENDHLFELFLSQDIVHIYVNSLATLTNYAKMEQDFIHEYNENLMLKAELAKKEHMVEKKIFDEVILRCSRLENRNVNLELKLQHQKESFLNNKSFNNQNAPEITEFFKINEWQAKLDAKDVSISNLRENIESLKGKNVVEKYVTPNKAKVIALGMFKLDLEPLTSKVLKNRDAHIYYIKHSQENADILQELVEHARALRSLDSDLDSACFNHCIQATKLTTFVPLAPFYTATTTSISMLDKSLSIPSYIVILVIFH